MHFVYSLCLWIFQYHSSVGVTITVCKKPRCTFTTVFSLGCFPLGGSDRGTAENSRVFRGQIVTTLFIILGQYQRVYGLILHINQSVFSAEETIFYLLYEYFCPTVRCLILLPNLLYINVAIT